MLRYYVKRSSGEEFSHVLTPPENHAWVHGDSVTQADLDTLASHYGFDRNVLHDVLDKNELPRVEKHDDGLYVFVTMAQRGKHGRVFTTPVLLAVRGTIFINISMAETEDHKLATPSVLAHSSDTLSLLLGTFAAIVGEYEGLTQRVGRRLHDTRRRLRTHEVTNDDFIQFVTVEDNLNTYQTNLNSMLVVAQRLKDGVPNRADQEAVEDILLYIRQLLVTVDNYSKNIVSIRDAYGTIANNLLNQRMKTLTVLTLLIALPNVFFGMYGMNMPLPDQSQPWAFPALISLIVVVVLLVYLVAKRLRIF